MRVIVDGVIVAKTGEGENIEVYIEKADTQASLIRLKNQNFYAKLKAKLNYWGD